MKPNKIRQELLIKRLGVLAGNPAYTKFFNMLEAKLSEIELRNHRATPQGQQIRGVSWHARNKKWAINPTINGKKIWLGYRITHDSAVQVMIDYYVENNIPYEEKKARKRLERRIT